MNTETIKSCPKCNAPIPPEAPRGLCPKCLLAGSIATEAGPGGEAGGPPSLESIAAGFPQLEILEFIGQGGMGLVFKARQPKLDRFVALKLLPQKPGADPAFCERFHREARVLARLSHPNIVAVHDFGEAGPFFYLLMEYVDGVNLRQAMRAGRFTPAQALAIVPRICDALQYAHEEGVLHRDIKPENLLLDTRGRIKIADFGIAKLLGENKDITLTASGSAVGTPHYMAPEQLERPQDVDQRADVYSLGVVFYEMLTGELPIGRFAPPSEKTPVDPRVDQVVLRTLEKERERRFQSAGDVKTQVEKITSGQTVDPPGSSIQAPPPLKSGQDDTTAASRRWSLRAVGSVGLVALSVFIFALVKLSDGHARPGEVAVLSLLIGIPAFAGTLLGYGVLRDLRAGLIQRRGGRLALLSFIAWPLLLLNLVLLSLPLFFFESLLWNVLHARTGRILVLVGLVATLAIVALDFWILRHLFKRWTSQRILPFTEVEELLKRVPPRMLWFSGAALTVVSLVLFISHLHIRALDQPDPPAIVLEPNAPQGFEVSPGGPPGDGRLYRSIVLIPPGYALTLKSVLCSNQVVLESSPANGAVTMTAPQGQPVQGLLSWRLLGNTTLADGAPLQLSMGFDGPDSRDKVFHVVPPESVNIDWVGEPPRLWPPQNGHTKFLLAKGQSASAGPGGEPATEWEVGIEARLDPVPENVLRELKSPTVSLGTNGQAVVEQVSAPPPTAAD